MASDELDLERGDPSRAEDDSPEGRRKARRTARKSGDSSSGDSKADAAKVDTEISSRLGRVFDRIAKTLEARGDAELADVVREDGEAMESGLVSLTRGIPFFRMPLLMLLNLIEPVLAFGRVVRILVTRWYERQALRKQHTGERLEGEEDGIQEYQTIR